MRFWAIPVIGVFLLVLGVTVYPLAVAILSDGQGREFAGFLYRKGPVAVWLILMGLCQAALLIRVNPGTDRLQARRKLLPAVIAGAFCFALLITTLLLSLMAGFYGDSMPEPIQQLADALPGDEEMVMGVALISFSLSQWIIWSLILWRFTRPGATEDFMGRLLRWLLAGSVLELLVAVPAHVMTRRRDDCCAPILTFWGMATGISLMLLCVGPGILLWFNDRRRRKLRAARFPLVEEVASQSHG